MSDSPSYPPEHPDFRCLDPDPESPCRLCRTDGAPICRATYGNYTCAREAGHIGEHAACGVSERSHPLLVWAKGEQERQDA